MECQLEREKMSDEAVLFDMKWRDCTCLEEDEQWNERQVHYGSESVLRTSYKLAILKRSKQKSPI